MAAPNDLMPTGRSLGGVKGNRGHVGGPAWSQLIVS